jgi:hypothetical protein
MECTSASCEAESSDRDADSTRSVGDIKSLSKINPEDLPNSYSLLHTINKLTQVCHPHRETRVNPSTLCWAVGNNLSILTRCPRTWLYRYTLFTEVFRPQSGFPHVCHMQYPDLFLDLRLQSLIRHTLKTIPTLSIAPIIVQGLQGG